VFRKYARAVWNDKEREELHAVYIIRNILIVATVIVFVLMLMCTNIPSEEGDEYSSSDAVIVILLFSFFRYLVGTIVFSALFASRSNKIISRPPMEGEMAEIIAYRKSLTEEKKRMKKPTIFMRAIIAASFLFLVIMFVIASCTEGEDGSSPLYSVGYIACIAGCCIGYIVLSTASLKNNLKDGAVTMSEVKRIDEAQGYVGKYDLRQDQSVQNLKYLFPDDALRKEEEAALANYSRALSATVIVLAIIAFAIFLVVILPLQNFAFGYFSPALIVFCYLSEWLMCRSAAKKMKEVEDKQREKIAAENLTLYDEVYKRHDEYTKANKKKSLAVCIASIVISLVVAIFFPYEIYSFVGFVIIIISALITNKRYAAFRRSLLPLEEKIDIYLAEKKKLNETEEIKEEANEEIKEEASPAENGVEGENTEV